MAPARHTSESVTLSHIRSHGCRDVLVYCCDVVCNHSVKINADYLPDDTPARSLGARMACTKCGRVGAEVQPDWSPHTSHMQLGVELLGRRRVVLPSGGREDIVQ